MGQRHILHCDCNCFYASVEMQEHPELRGKSIAVCGDPEARHGIVLTASYPAKRMGVKTGMPIWEAKQHCRDLIIVPASYGKYQKYSGYVREVFNDYTDQVESFGLDEAWLDITGSVGLFGSPVKIAKEISARIKRELGITVSIGVSFNKITAKLGSDYKKPDAITIIEPENYKKIVYPLPAGDLLYVGAATQRKLDSYGIRTIGQLAETNPETLKGWFGVMGYTLSAFARGLDQTPVAKQNAHTAIKSVGNSATTPRDLTTDEDVLPDRASQLSGLPTFDAVRFHLFPSLRRIQFLSGRNTRAADSAERLSLRNGETMSENLFGLTVAADKGLDDLQCQRLLSENRRYQEVMLQYRCALKALESRLEILNEEFSLQHDRNPIESMKSRLKSPSSIMNKMQKRGLSLDFPTMQANIMDIAGVRVICSFEEDVFFLAKCLKDQSDIEIITEKDYISHPILS